MHEPLATSGESGFYGTMQCAHAAKCGPRSLCAPPKLFATAKSRGEAERANLPPCWKQSALAEEMKHAGDIERESIGIQIRAVAARGPAGEIKQSVFILLEHGQ